MKNIALAIAILFSFGAKTNGQQTLTNGKATLMAGTHIKNRPNATIFTQTIVNSDSVLISNSNNKTSTLYIQDETKQDEAQRTKTYSKIYTIDKNDKVSVSNKFGTITIKTWDKNEVKLDAEIKAFANSESEAQKLIDDVDINSFKEADVVSFKTSIESANGSWGKGSRNGKNWRREVKINVTVFMPAINALSATQQYGNIQMDDFYGATSIKVQYGNFTANNLKSNNNYISIQYGKGDIKTATQLKINHQYGGGLTIGSVADLELTAQYTSVNIADLKQASIKQQYGNGITIGNAGPLNINVQYSTLNIANLNGNLTSKVQYGKLNINEIKTNCKAIDISADYTIVNLRFAENYNANFDLKTTYGSFKYGNNVNAKRLDNEERYHSSDKSYTGTIGKGGNASIRISSDYGGVVFK